MTNHDWPLKATIIGLGFHGPATLFAKSYQTSKYPLLFRPQNENPVTVSWIFSIENTAWGNYLVSYELQSTHVCLTLLVSNKRLSLFKYESLTTVTKYCGKE